MITRLSQTIRESVKDSKRNFSSIAALLMCLLCFAATALAGDDVFMKVEGVQGDSADAVHRGEIDVLTYSQTFGTKACSEIVVTKRIDSASPQLIGRAVNNMRLPNVIITIRRAGGKQQEYFKATLLSVVIDRIELTENAGGDQTERVVLQPGNILIQFWPQDAKGNLASTPIVTSFSCK